ncbi:hypothetical protein CPLU01_05798 [Colletotrichum plurivorum]|uniref:Uncharacterized protein n=1 Tax=Colletotrichum plurivorum TaxID=2175906 RepID=A0A8H6KK43_9PEZI|nr:hypothetical protein CPLU01_05798 [Colletotrichum plurivorum]
MMTERPPAKANVQEKIRQRLGPRWKSRQSPILQRRNGEGRSVTAIVWEAADGVVEGRSGKAGQNCANNTSIAKPARHHGEGELDIASEKDAASSKIIANCCHKPGRAGPRHWTDGEKDRDSG